ncbi:MAG: 2-succinylbenzoate--CoA ligase [Gloeotrichia echinulata IR180]|jgi:O-succinylbenzoic acid--CoA ligase|nr:2-succinylbenzoate--CoA ligase [Gloeotrichia echinulata DEX184]
MELPIEKLRNRFQDNWLLGDESQSQTFISLTETLFQEIAEYPPQKILLSEPNPIRFLASFIAACSTNHHVFLANPSWGLSEWQQVFELVKPDIVWGNCEYAQQYNISFHNQSLPENKTNSLIMIPTGGSSGKIRFAMHNWQTLIASVKGFREYFQVSEVNSICVLPLYHVSGLMQFMRSFILGGQLLILPFKELKTGKSCDFNPTNFFISLVPTQLQYLLSESNLTTWLSQCQTVLLGGAPAWSDLLEKARFHHIKLAPSYGMTETASQIATLKPESFLSGKNSSYQVLPHAKVKICNAVGELLCSQKIGQIVIESSSLALGYYPEPFPESGIFYPDDLGFLDAEANLNIVGRSSYKIITGGENVFPSEVEAAILSTNLVKDVAVIGKDDSYWGQIIAAIYVPINQNIAYQQIQDAINVKITRLKIPKLWISINIMPRNEQGKVNFQQLQELVNRHKALD